MGSRVLVRAATVAVAVALVVMAVVAVAGQGAEERERPQAAGAKPSDVEGVHGEPDGGRPRYDFVGDASGLPVEARAWYVDEQDGATRAAALAAAFGLSEPVPGPSELPDAWESDGGTLRVDAQPGLSWRYGVGVSEDPGASDASPSGAEAEAVARKLLAQIGVDLAGARIRVEVDSSLVGLSISTHCGVEWARFDGRYWDAVPPLGDGNAPLGWFHPQTGMMVLLAPDQAMFVADADGTEVRFVPRPVEVGPPPPCG